ncbi:MAG TPA: hypothetical protein EYP60_02545 [bacterium (Candidatus Stahlbacteria)]|nr:hypothetical protein [Candidatus Stahlbacteria bacterium]
MRRRETSCVRVIAMVLLLLAGSIIYQSAVGTVLEMPTANLKVENAVPFDTIRAIALRNAKALWGEPIAMGPAIPYCDLDGNIRAYSFSFCIGRNSFPDYDDVLEEIKRTHDNGVLGDMPIC